MVAQVDLVVHLTMLQALIVGQNPGALITNLHCLLSNYYWLTTKEWKKKWLIHTGKFNQEPHYFKKKNSRQKQGIHFSPFEQKMC